MKYQRLFLFVIACVLLSSRSFADEQKPLPVVASFSILADLVSQIGGEQVNVTMLVGPGGDAHVYEPTPGDARQLAEAKLLVVNGLGFEGWMDRLVSASGYHGTVLTASKDISLLHVSGAESHHSSEDPHAWQSVPNVLIYVNNIEEGLCEATPKHCPVFRQRAAQYRKELQSLDGMIRQSIASVAPEARKVITSHDAFSYFAREYGVTFLAPVGISTENEATAKEVAGLIEQIRQEKVRALFVENISDPRLLAQIAREAGVTQQGTLYSDALSGQDGPASTYLAMMQHNVAMLVSGMRGDTSKK